MQSCSPDFSQVLCNMIHFGMDPQRALDAPRFCIGPGHAGSSGSVALEEGISGEAAKGLRAMGHPIEHGVSGDARKVLEIGSRPFLHVLHVLLYHISLMFFYTGGTQTGKNGNSLVCALGACIHLIQCPYPYAFARDWGFAVNNIKTIISII